MPIPHRTLSAVVCCKACNQNIPSGQEGEPSQPIVAKCPICKAARQYLPIEVFLGAPSYKVSAALLGR